MSPAEITCFQKALLAWYNAGHRPMPWRETASPYAIWLAEVMLQQTTVATVIPYYQRFIERFPSVHHLAAAPLEDILHLWQGLGYYRRAHLLHRCAQVISSQLNGHFPTTLEELLQLPGLGPYTAHVIMATAYNQPATVVDGNVERVLTRLLRLQNPLPAAKREITAHAAAYAHGAPPRTYANAIMELGATQCTPKNPTCTTCPVNMWCQGFKQGDAATYPRKIKPAKVPQVSANCWLITTPNRSQVYLQQRPANGMLASLWELPHSGTPNLPSATPPMAFSPGQKLGTITHTFSHFKLTLTLHHATASNLPQTHSFPVHGPLPPLSTLMKKALTQGLKHLT